MTATEINDALQPYGASLGSDGFICRNSRRSGVKIAIKGNRIRFESAEGYLFGSGRANCAAIENFVESFWYWTKGRVTA